MITLLVDATIQVSAVLLVGLAAAALARRASAAVRHAILSAAIVAGMAAPLLALVVPAWQAAPHRSSAAGTASSTFSADTASLSSESAVPPAPAIADGASAMARRLIVPIWFAGTAISVLLLLIGLGRLALLASRSERMREPAWTSAAGDIALEYGLFRDVVLLHSDHPTLLVTWGQRRPKVILPQTAPQWPDDRIRVVLCHELAHIRRHDWMLLMTAELLRSLHWFNPIVWIACRRLREQSEHACDDVVLGAGIERSDYAAQLLDLARAVVDNHTSWSAALAIARPSTLEGRIRAMLNIRLNRQPTTRWAGAVIALVTLGVTVPLAGFTSTSEPIGPAAPTERGVVPPVTVVRLNVLDKGSPEVLRARRDPAAGVVAGTTLAQTAFASYSGRVVDSLGALLPDVTLTLVNLQSRAKQEVRSDRTGRFDFVGLPGGDYAMEARLAGFATLQQNVTFSPGQIAEQNLTLQIGSITETITVTEGDHYPPDYGTQSLSVRKRESGSLPTCSAPVAGGIGGNIKPPTKVRNVNPTYPPSARDAKVQGVVILHAVIGIDGFMKDVSVLRSPDAALAAAATDAVSQWQFQATQLDCVPVDTRATVVVNFQLAR
jgi:TonB family protein